MKRITILLFLILPIITTAQTVIYKSGHVAIVPNTYATDTSKLWPTIIFLHGSGERGLGTETDLQKVVKVGLPKYLKDGRFLILCPQTNAWSWRTRKADGAVVNDAVEFTKWAIGNYRIDSKQVYVTGLSMGGEGTWFALADAPWLYAAGAPVCGRASRTEGGLVGSASVPVWAFHGSADIAIPFESDWNAIAGYRSVNKSLIFTVYEGVGHNCWDRAYSNMALYVWFLKYRKP